VLHKVCSHNLHVKSSKNTLYFSRSLCSSNTTSNRLPEKLFAATAAVHASTSSEENDHLIAYVEGVELGLVVR
jgi:hypothetical protein